ncbi:MAG TPA: DNA-formamidopyrimidine glycosylase, partial [Firmicutes bacterium]|nr:DNA-formamidopyrimidine glycosylase [Bacillota bacterium]
MPELPEVETFKKALEPALLNRTILSINLIYEKTISTNKDEFLSILKNKKITKLGRKGKFLLFFLSSPYVLISHLRMEGKFFVEPKEEKRKKHDLVEFNLDNDTKLVYNDVRKFGFIGLYKASSYLKDSPLSNLGKEPFEISKEELFIGLHKRKAEIKEALLDQTIMSGLGNIYDDEVLFDCKINPRTPSNQISLSQAQNIISSSIKILNKAIEKNGSTIKSFHFKENQNGDMQNFLKVYGKEH